MYPGSATGVSLDRSVSFTGVSRYTAERSRAYVVLYGAPGTTVPGGAQIRHQCRAERRVSRIDRRHAVHLHDWRDNQPPADPGGPGLGTVSERVGRFQRRQYGADPHRRARYGRLHLDGKPGAGASGLACAGPDVGGLHGRGRNRRPQWGCDAGGRLGCCRQPAGRRLWAAG
ncbi:hypothetical protein G6F35_014654 [Rhizopus arrhizus]|nr:hypothetical protein G6F35_014654 [Rhizopus arrhizus]